MMILLFQFTLILISGITLQLLMIVDMPEFFIMQTLVLTIVTEKRPWGSRLKKTPTNEHVVTAHKMRINLRQKLEKSPAFSTFIAQF